MKSKTLHQIYADHDGKVSDKWSLYISEYERLFAEFQKLPVRLLEIGIQNGGSLEIWAEYFDDLKNAVGCEINPASNKLKYDNPNIKLVIGDANHDETEHNILDLCKSYEIIIDDGSHLSGDIVASFTRYFPYLENNGLYIVEDLHCSYWEDFDGGLFEPLSSMEFFKLLTDIINHEHWKVDKKRVDLLISFKEQYKHSIDEEVLQTIHSIEFVNSMCIIRKATPSHNTLGSRILTGTEESVIPLSKILDEFKDQISDQTNNMCAYQTNSIRDDLIQQKVENNKLRETLSECQIEIENLKDVNSELTNTVNHIMNSSSWLITKPLRSVGNVARLMKKLIDPRKYTGFSSDYDIWSKTSGEKEAEEIITRLPQLKKPLISIIVPTYNTDEKHLRSCIESVLAQSYSNWELCIADDASPQQYVRDLILEYSKNDSRIKSIFREVNGHISEAITSATSIASGDYFAFLDHDDELNRHALLFIVDVINKVPDAEMLYTDEDHINENGKFSNPFFKPDWSPALLYSQNYICHFLCLSKSLYNRVGGIRNGYDGAQDYDLILRASHSAKIVYHIPKVLYHWREHKGSTSSNVNSKPYAHDAGKQAVHDFLSHKYPTIFSDVKNGKWLFTYSPIFKCDRDLRVSIIIPTRDKTELLNDCIKSIRKHSSHNNWEIIIVDNCSEEPESHEYFSKVIEDKRIKVVPAQFEFNWSKINNLGAKSATGDVYIFLNNDTLVISPDWIEKLTSWAILPDVGPVGPQLLYEDKTIQHAGVVVGMGGWADHVFKKTATHSLFKPFCFACTKSKCSGDHRCLSSNRKI